MQILIDTNLYAGLVINEGIPGDNTVKALERFETVLSTHLAKFLLFHLGTNDVVHLDIPVSTIVYNIDYMMNKALNINIQPVLSTLIPRNTKFNEGIFRQRAVNVSQEIRQMAYRLNIPFIDFWQIFSDYPDSDGGYDSLMSDHVHPSEKGYQLMAQEWLEELKKIPPAKPEKVIIDVINQLQARVNWAENIEPDLSHYLVEFGFSLAHLDRQEITQDTSYTFHLFPLHLPYYQKIYFTIRAVDKYGNASQPTSIYQFEFQ